MEHVTALSHRGRRHPKNEDSVLSVELDDDSILLAVADGVGGERAGEVASREAVWALETGATALCGAPPLDRLHQAVQQANAAVWQRSEESPNLQGMATTVVAAIIGDGQAWLANVGDSRAYLIHEGRIEQITRDHSLVAERVREGDLTASQARSSSVRHIITRSIGSDEQVQVDLFGPIALPADSWILLCSDGLHDVVEDAEIAAIIGRAPAAEGAKRLIAKANEKGGPDNISVVLYHAAVEDASEARRREATALEPPSRYAIASITTVIAVIAGGIAAWASR